MLNHNNSNNIILLLVYCICGSISHWSCNWSMTSNHMLLCSDCIVCAQLGCCIFVFVCRFLIYRLGGCTRSTHCPLPGQTVCRQAAKGRHWSRALLQSFKLIGPQYHIQIERTVFAFTSEFMSSPLEVYDDQCMSVTQSLCMDKFDCFSLKHVLPLLM